LTILVTGATGFIGAHLACHLADKGHQVRALVRHNSLSLTGSGVELACGEITDPDALRIAVDGVEAIFHLAAQRDVWGTPDSTYHRVNVEGTRYLLNAAAQACVQRVVYCSSVGVARYPGNLNADETLPYTQPSSQVAYHRTKAQAEQAVLRAARHGTVPGVVVRPVITYGPGDRTGMITQLLDRLAHKRFVPVGNGQNHLDLAYVDDVVTGLVLAWERGTVGQVYILSGPRPVTMQEVLAAAHAALGKPGPGPIYIPTNLGRFLAGLAERVSSTLGGRPPVTRDAVATLTVDRGFSHARATRELGYQPRLELGEGLRRTAEWWSKQGNLGGS
jgi:nucleoside-diphosphate-sugar epimerase